MQDVEDLIQRVGQAKAFIDNGLCRVGPKLKPGHKLEALLAGGASRALALSDAVVRLCRHDHSTEALPLLRQLTEVAVVLRWAAAGDDAEERAKTALKEMAAARWDTLWPAERVSERAAQAGISQQDLGVVLEGSVDFVVGNSTGAPWSHIFTENQRPAADPQAVLAAAVRMMGHVLRAMDVKWAGDFPGAEAMWESS
ncbi:MAG: DUF5677 domain-containing protein [Elusimicrobiota bacterium]